MKAKLLTVTGLPSVLILTLYVAIGLMYASPALMKDHEDIYDFLWKSVRILHLPFLAATLTLYTSSGAGTNRLCRWNSRSSITPKSNSLADIKNKEAGSIMKAASFIKL